MVKIKEIKTKSVKRKTKITVKSLIADVKNKLHKEKINAVMAVLECKYRELESAKQVVAKLTKQIKEIENKDISEIDTDNFEYNEDNEDEE